MELKKIAEKTFETELVLERSITPVVEKLGRHISTMILFEIDKGDLITDLLIEWDIPDLDETYHIQLSANPNKDIIDYDGVFDLPKEAIELLNENGFTTKEVE